MKYFFLFILFSFSWHLSPAQEVEIMSWKTFKKEILKPGEKTKVINFWATWCGPCVAELPDFEKVGQESKDSVEMIFVSLDNRARLEEKVLPFLARKQIRSKVVLLDDVDFNSWMPKINKNWGGEIPATIILHQDKQEFHSSKMTREELIELINKTRRL